MTQNLLLLFWLGVIGVCGGHVFRERHRRRALARAAGACSLAYSPRDSLNFTERYAVLQLFQQGHDRFAYDVFTGISPAGRIQLFSYSYDLGFGSDRQHVRWAVGVVETHRIRSRVSSVEVAILPFEFAGDATGLTVRGEFETAPAEMAAVKTWVEQGRQRYHVEIADRFVAIYLLRDGFAGMIDSLLADVTDLAGRLEDAVEENGKAAE